MLIHLGSKPVLVASSADAACEIMKTHDLIFANRPKSSIGDKLVYRSKDVAFAPYGDYWRQVRNICVLHLLSTRRVKSFRAIREEETSLMIANINRKCGSSSSLSSLLNLSDLFLDLAKAIISKVALSRKYGAEESETRIRTALAELVDFVRGFSVGDYIPWLGWVNRLNGLQARVEKTFEEMDQYLGNIIEEHKNKGSMHDIHDESLEARSPDFLDTLLEVQRENLTGFHIERDTLKALIVDMLVGGTETSRTVLVWVMIELLRHPEVMEKLQTEVREVAEGKTEIREDDLDKLHFLKAVIKETLRFHAPLPLLLPRESTQDIKVMGYDIPAGKQVLVNAWAIGRDPMLWEKAEEFLPERFVDTDIDF